MAHATGTDRCAWPRSCDRPGVELQAKLDAHGIVQRRIRVVTTPLTEYLRWELHLLRIWAELGEEIKALRAEHVRRLEPRHPLPEVLVLGGEDSANPVMYEILYERGELAGARKFVDPDFIAGCRAEIAKLWDAGEWLAAYSSGCAPNPTSHIREHALASPGPGYSARNSAIAGTNTSNGMSWGCPSSVRRRAFGRAATSAVTPVLSQGI
jgi:hypothetical protein